MSSEHQIPDFAKPNFSSQPVAGNATIPPKLQQLLNQISDVDKVKLLQIASHYKLDLDDPAYLPLLLTREGIEALENATERLNQDAYKVVDYAIQKAESAVSKTAGAKIDEIEEAKNRAETAFKNAVSAWSYEVFESAVSSALKTSLPGAAAAASEVSIILIERLENATNSCIQKINSASEAVERLNSNQTLPGLLIMLLLGVLLGVGGSYLAIPKAVEYTIKKTVEETVKNQVATFKNSNK